MQRTRRKQNIEELLIKLALSILRAEWGRNPVGKVSCDPVIKICNIMHKQNEADLTLHGQRKHWHFPISEHSVLQSPEFFLMCLHGVVIFR